MKKQPWLLALMAALGVVLLSLTAWSGLGVKTPYPKRYDYLAKLTDNATVIDAETQQAVEDCPDPNNVDCPEGKYLEDNDIEGVALFHVYKNKWDADFVKITDGRVGLGATDPNCRPAKNGSCIYYLWQLSVKFGSAKVHGTSIKNGRAVLVDPVAGLVDSGGGLFLPSGTKFQVTTVINGVTRYFRTEVEDGLHLGLDLDGEVVTLSGTLSGESDGLELKLALLDTSDTPFLNVPPSADGGPDQELEESCYANVSLASQSTDKNDNLVSSSFRYHQFRLGSNPTDISFLTGVREIGLVATDTYGSKDADYVRVTVVHNGEVELPDGGSLVDFEGPSDLPFEEIALLSKEALKVSDRVSVSGADGATTNVVNIGAATNNIKSHFHADSAITGDVWTRPKGWLLERAAVSGTFHSPVMPDRQSMLDIGFYDVPYEFESLEKLAFAIPAPEGAVTVGSIEPDQTEELEGNDYGYTHVKSRARLRLLGGAYRFSQLWMEPDSVLELTSGEPTVIVVDQGGTFRGRVEGPGEVFLIQLGTNETIVTSPFVGTVLAPNGKLTLNSSNKTKHVGTFFAKELQVDSDAVIEHRPAPFELFTGARDACALKPVLQCVADTSDGLAARFAYENAIDYDSIRVPVGYANRLVPGDNFQGQPTAFLADYYLNRTTPTFEVPFEGKVTWVLGAQRATATENSPRCN